MRICLAISVVIHAVVMLWLWLGPGARALDSVSAEPILVDLVPPQDALGKTESEPPKSEQTKQDEPKPEEIKPELSRATPREPVPAKAQSQKAESAKPEASRPAVEADKPPVPNSDPSTAAEERAATAARLAWLLNLPTDTEVSLAAPPSESKSSLTSEQIADFKGQVNKCWRVPAGVPATPGFNVLIRIALSPSGRLGAKPELVRAPASAAGPALVDSAKQALQQCQPYTGLPADKYKDWKLLELTFTADGPASLSGPAVR